VRFDEPEIFIHVARNLSEDVGGVLVPEFVDLIDRAPPVPAPTMQLVRVQTPKEAREAVCAMAT
jgi:hypothetical protein